MKQNDWNDSQRNAQRESLTWCKLQFLRGTTGTTAGPDSSDGGEAPWSQEMVGPGRWRASNVPCGSKRIHVNSAQDGTWSCQESPAKSRAQSSKSFTSLWYDLLVSRNVMMAKKKNTSQRGTEGHWFVERWSHPLLIYSVLRPKSARPSELTFESFPACALVFCGLPTCRTIVLRIYDAYCAKAAVLGFGHGQFMMMCSCCCVAAGIERDLCILNKDLGKYDFQHKHQK